MILTSGCQNKDGAILLRAKTWMIMKLTIALMLFFTFQVSANGNAQQITIVKKNASLTEIFKTIERQTGYLFFYDKAMIQKTDPIDIAIRNATLEQALSVCLKGQDLTYSIVKNTVVISPEKKTTYFKAQSTLMPLETPEPPPPVEITGRVVNKDGNPLSGVSVLIVGTKRGAITNSDGRFKLNVSNSANITLEVSSVGFQTKRVNLGSQTEINITLENEISGLNEVVVVGFGTQKRKDLTGAVASVSSKDIQNLSVTQVDQALMGKVAGVQVKPVSGQPGAPAQIRVRGIGSISAGGDPLYVVDGFPIDNIQGINPNDIESIDILKDASATAIYGSRGSNGVIIINTKRGKSGKPNINFDAYYGLQKVSRIPKYMNAKEQAEFAYYAVKNRNLDLGNDISGPENAWAFPVPKTVLDVLAGTNKTDVSAIEAVMHTAPESQYQLSAIGGSDNIKYALSGEYLDQGGIILNSGFKRYSLRANIDAQLSKRLTIKLNLNPNYINQWGQDPSGTGYGTTILGNAASVNPYNPVYDANGDYFIFNSLPEVGNFPNPVALAKEVIDKNNRMGFIGNMNIQYSLSDALKLSIIAGANFINNKGMRFVPFLPSLLNATPSGSDDASMTYNWLTEYLLNYDRSFGNHNISGVVGYTVQKERGESNTLSSNKFSNNLVPTISGAGGLINSGSSDVYEWSLVSYLGRINYNYASKYYVTASIRTDGSSRFGSEHKYGLFPSVALAWRISEENFLKDVNFLSTLKLRASYGETGNNNIGNYEHLATIHNVLYPVGGGAAIGYTPGRLPNNSLTWEKQRALNEGLDAGFFKERLLITVDHFQSQNTDLLLNVNVPAISGFTTALTNIGQVNNNGWEFVVSTVNFRGKFYWSTDLNFSTYKNKVVRLGSKGDPIIGSENITEIGQPIGMFYGLLTDGIFKTQAELDKGPLFAPGTAPGTHLGDVRFVDLSGPNGKPDGIIDSYDRTIMGSPYPDFYYGMTNNFSFQNFSLSISLQGVHGNKIMSEVKRVSMRGEFRVNQLAVSDNFWKSEQDPGDSPRPNDEPTGGLRSISTRYLDDGTYLRINNILLSYSLPDKISQKLNLKTIRFYLNATNPFLFTKNLGFNPDVSNGTNALTPGVDNNNYPLAKSIRLGLNISF